MSLTDAQKALRRTGIGGSEVAAVLGEATRKTDDGAIKTGFDVWVEKTTGLESITTVDAERGIFLEPGVVDWYLSRTGFAKGMTLGTVKHATRPVALCTPDLLAIRPDNVGRLTSVKCPRHGWDWGPSGSDDVPQDYVLQLQWEHAICSSFMPAGALDAQMDLAALVNGELRVYPFTADAELQGWMLDDAEAWWKRHITDGIEPPLDASAGARGYLKRKWKQTGEMRTATVREELLLEELRLAEAEQQRVDEHQRTCRRLVEAAIGSNAGLIAPLGVVTWKADKNGTRVFRTNWKATKEKRA